MIAFICSTPYQILLAINIKYKLHHFDDADIYVLNHFSESKDLTERLEETRLFKSVKHVDSIGFTKSFSKNKILRLKENLFYKRKVEKFFQFKSHVYGEIYFSYPDLMMEWVVGYLYDRNRNLKVHLYEDGIGAYDSYIADITVKRRIINLITGLDKKINRYDDILIFRPEMYSGNINTKINKIPDIDKHDTFLKNMINKVFDYKDNYEINEKIVFLDQPMDFIKGLNETIKAIVDEILEDDYIIKLHPRSGYKYHMKHKIFKNNSTPWEVICLNNEIENKILISYFSTAGISSKILFDKEPIVIFLFDLIELKRLYKISDNFEEFSHKFKNNYRDSKRVFIPQNIEELQIYLKDIKSGK